jgi:hypothetical protein
MTGECACGTAACCRVLPLLIARLDPVYLKYLRCRGLKEDQGFILIPHDCQHLKSGVIWDAPTQEPIEGFLCDIHDSPERPKLCSQFHGQKQIGRARIYIPPGCTMRKKE